MTLLYSIFMTASPATPITIGGWINLTLSVTFVTVLCAWTLTRVLRGGGKKGK